MTKREKAAAYFQSGFNCAQSVFTALAAGEGISEEICLKMTTPFGAGMVYRGEACGAITGSMMALGLFHGKSKTDDFDSKELTYLLVDELKRKFEAKHGSIYCRKLLNMENSGREEWEKAEKLGYFETKCPVFVNDAVLITEQLMEKLRKTIK